MSQEENKIETETTFEELPDAPPRRKIRFTISGKIVIFFVLFWVLMVSLGHMFLLTMRQIFWMNLFSSFLEEMNIQTQIISRLVKLHIWEQTT